MSERIIPRDDVGTPSRWELPGFDAPPAPQPAPELNEPLPRLPTLEEIEAIQQAAQAEGYQTGLEQGRQEGEAAGRSEGYAAGHAEGLSTGHAEGLSAGHAEGFAAGHAEGLARGEADGAAAAAARAEAELNGRLALLDELARELARPLQTLDAELEADLLTLVVAIARQLVRRELRTAPGEIVAVIREAVPLLPVANRSIEIRLHPEDAALVRELGLGGEDWRLLEDPTLSRGGCQLNAEHSHIDASVETRLGKVVATLLGSARGEEAGDER
ncbi:flagellar assembly protein FliH [Plasticicumulans acidivorans]|uniref:Flagellar assembly protein FliH n=1 Tax=Plasticicumulans acidivorans TaxID=886464 RepID=A0A317MX12_9GAMM|nr:flagellar assembly protein FliH [Plasticicumulans acidivorans]PWV63280.1 flagellar assembly protein FliH [Plasticicumulans acidivorans]